MAEDKKSFLERYAHCASVRALKKIWEAKRNKAILLDLNYKKINDLSPLTSLINLKEIDLFGWRWGRKTRG